MLHPICHFHEKYKSWIPDSLSRIRIDRGDTELINYLDTPNGSPTLPPSLCPGLWGRRLIVTVWHWHWCPALPIVRPALTRVVTERINDLPGLTFLLFWFFNLSQCHMHLISIGSPHHSCGGARARVWDKNSSELDSYFSWNKTKDDLQWKTLL